jgi:pyrroline-5-carboxylate reductase
MVEGPPTERSGRIQMKATVFLGAGRITGALVAGLHLAGYKRPVIVYDRNPDKLRAIRRAFPVEAVRDLATAVERAGMLILAVQPASVADLLDEVVRCGAMPPAVAVSLAAGVPLKRLRTRLKPPVRWARAMPSPVCRIGRGLTAVTFGPGLASNSRKRVRELFAHVGLVVEIPESLFDAFTATFSPSHGYHALATLAKAAQGAGLDRKTSFTAAAHALAEGILYWRQSKESLANLLHEAATRGGTAAATMKAMDKAGYGKVIPRGLQAGVAQARRNARRT